MGTQPMKPIDRIAGRVAKKLSDLLDKRQPEQPHPPVDNRLMRDQ